MNNDKIQKATLKFELAESQLPILEDELEKAEEEYKRLSNAVYRARLAVMIRGKECAQILNQIIKEQK